MSLVGLLTMLLNFLFAPYAQAQTSCVPNPNLQGPPFINGCPLPAAGLNRMPGLHTTVNAFTSNSPNAMIFPNAPGGSVSFPGPWSKVIRQNMGGEAIVEPMLLQPLLDGGADGFANILRSAGAAGVDESQLDDGGGAGVPELVGHGGGAELLRVLEPAGGAAG